MIDTSQVWMTIGRAAAVAGVATRTAFRWVEEGRIEVRREGASRLIEVGALKALARGGVPSVAGASANSNGSIPAGAPPATPDRISGLEARISGLGAALLALGDRVREIDRRLGIPPGIAAEPGDPPSEGAP